MEKDRYTIGIITGSLRKASLCQKLANLISNLNTPGLNCEHIMIGELPMYNEDLETDEPPASWQDFRNRIRLKDAILFITPEYNRSVPAVLKNAVDIGSAPHGQNVFNKKPAAIISLSPGKMGAFGANHHLRQALVFLNMPTMQQPEAYIGNSETLFTETGFVATNSTHVFISDFMRAFAAWIKIYKL